MMLPSSFNVFQSARSDAVVKPARDFRRQQRAICPAEFAQQAQIALEAVQDMRFRFGVQGRFFFIAFRMG